MNLVIFILGCFAGMITVKVIFTYLFRDEETKNDE